MRKRTADFLQGMDHFLKQLVPHNTNTQKCLTVLDLKMRNVSARLPVVGHSECKARASLFIVYISRECFVSMSQFKSTFYHAFVVLISNFLLASLDWKQDADIGKTKVGLGWCHGLRVIRNRIQFSLRPCPHLDSKGKGPLICLIGEDEKHATVLAKQIPS